MIITGNNFYKTLDGNRFPFTDAKSKKDAWRYAENHNLNRRQSLEEVLGRRLTDSEWLKQSVDHIEDRDFLQRMVDDKWEPIKKQPGRFDTIKAELYKEIEYAEDRKLSKAELRLRDIERIEQREAEKTEAEQSKKDYLDSPAVKKALQELNTLKEIMKFDDTRTKSEVIAVEQAIRQWREGDAAEARRMLKAVLDHEDERAHEINEAKRQQIERLQDSLLPEKPAWQKIQLDPQPFDIMAHNLYMELDQKGAPFEVLERVNGALEQMRAGNPEPIKDAIGEYGNVNP